MQNLPEFVGAVWNHWVAVMSGILALVLSIYARIRKHEVGNIVFFCLALFFIFFATFLAWNDEHKQRMQLEKSKPELRLSMMFIGFMDEEDVRPEPAEKGAHALVLANVVNVGAPSAAVGYEFVAYSGGNSYTGTPAALPQPHIDIFQDRQIVRIPSSEALYDKTFAPIPLGGAVPGILLFTFEGISYRILTSPESRFVLRCSDIEGKTYSAELKMGEKNVGNPIKYWPGLKMEMIKPPVK